MSVSIVIPCYNEEEIIKKVVTAYYSTVIDKIEDSEFIVVDDCSSDSTHTILEVLSAEFPKLKVLKTPVNVGHGKAIRMGYKSAKKDYVFQADSDGQFDADDFWRLYAFKDSYDLVLGLRKKRNDPMPRLVLTKLIIVMNFVIFGAWLKDANCPFRLMKKGMLDELLNMVDGEAFAPNIMVSILAHVKKFKIKEIPVTHYQRKTGVVSIRKWNLVKSALMGLNQLLQLKKTMIENGRK